MSDSGDGDGMGRGFSIGMAGSVPASDERALHDPDPAAGIEPVRTRRCGGVSISWLPRSPYETRLVERTGSIGIALDAQRGEDAIGSDRLRPFFVRPNTLAWLPPGCDVYSRSGAGGDYLKIEGPCIDACAPGMAEPFSDRGVPGLASVAARLQRAILAREGDVMAEALDALTILCELGAGHGQGQGHERAGQRCRTLDAARLRRALETIEAHLAEPLRVADLATSLGLSTGFFARAFQHAVGCSPHRWLMQRRLAEARRRLHGDAPLSRIALDTGFSSDAHLCRRFRHAYGVTPGQVRKGRRGTGGR